MLRLLLLSLSALLLLTPLARAQDPFALAARQEARMQALERQIGELIGQLERLQFENRQLRGQMEKMQTDFAFRLDELEAGGGGGAAAPSAGGGAANPGPAAGGEAPQDPVITRPARTPAAPAAGSLNEADILAGRPSNNSSGEPPRATGYPATPDGHYQYAYGLVGARDFPGARQALEDFLTRYPRHDYASNAWYWLGETYYAERNYSDAARTFAEGYKALPEGSKAGDTLYKLGVALRQMGRKDQACVALRRVADQPNTPRNTRANAAEEVRRLECG